MTEKESILNWANRTFGEEGEAGTLEEARWYWERKVIRWLINIEQRLRELETKR